MKVKSPEEVRPGAVALVGVPSDENSSLLRGPAQAPERIREVLYSGSSSDCSEDGTVILGGGLDDAGDLAFGAGEKGFQEIERGVGALLDRGAHVLALGGDHAITWPVVRAHAARDPNLAILQFDAHPDLYDDFEGNRLSHASPLARIMEAGLARRLVQVGIRSTNKHLREQAERFAVEQVTMRDFTPDVTIDFGAAPVYVTIDLDVLDPAYAPGVSHHEPGGLSVRDILRVLEKTAGRIIGADIVELNPLRDPVGTTAAVAAKLVKELAARILADARHGSMAQPRSRLRN